MRCFYHNRCGEVNLVAPVLLMCDCLVAICQECAKKELLTMFSAERHKKKVLTDNIASENKYEAFLCCPKCKGKVSSHRHNIIKGAENALEAEERLLLAAMTDAGMSYYKHTTDLAELQRCWDTLSEDCVNPIKTEPNVRSDHSSPNEETEPVQVARLRKKIAALAYEHNPHYDNPLDMLSFTTNNILSRIQEQPPSQNTTSTGMEHSHHEGVSGITECIVCTNTLQSGCSVQLTCSCNHIMCRNCALINIHYRPETYHQGVSCPQCRALSPGVLLNTHTVREIEDLLIQSARHYVTNRLLTFREKSVPENERQNCLQMIKLYHAIGYDGNINILNEKERDSASLARLKLEVAKLEEVRLHTAGLLDSYSIRCDINNAHSARRHTATNTETNAASKNNTVDRVTDSDDNDHTQAGKFPISFMHALKVCKNTFFEHYYLHNQSVSADTCTVAAQLADCQAQCASLITKLQELLYAHNNYKLDLLDKLVLVCIKIHCTSITHSPTATSSDTIDTTDTTSTSSTTTDITASHTGCTINQLVIMIWNYLKHPEFQFHKYFNSANNKSEFMSVVYRRVTPQAIQASVKKLVLKNVVNLVVKDVTLYQDERYILSDNGLKDAQLDPHLVVSLSPRYYTDYSLLTPCNTSSSVPSSVAGATSASTNLLSTSLSRVIPATNTNDSERASPTVYKVYSARATLIDPNRPVKKKKGSTVSTSSVSNSTTSSSTSNNNNTILADATSNSSSATAAAVLPLSTTTTSLPVDTVSSTTIPSVLKKRGPGRPPLVDKETDPISADRIPGAAGNSNSGKAYAGNNPEGKQFIFVIDPATGKKCRKYLDSFDVPTTTAKTSSLSKDGTSATSQACVGVGNKRSAESESESELVDTSDEEAYTKPKRKLQKVRATSSNTGASTNLNILQKEATDSRDADKRMKNSDDYMDVGNGSDGGGGSQSDTDVNCSEHDSNHSDNNSNINSDDDSGSEHSSTHSTPATHTTQQQQQQQKQTQLQEMISSLKHAANEAFKDAARVREENKLLRTELASMRNTNVFTLPAQKIEIDKFKARTAELKEQLKAEQSHRQILEQEKNAAEAARAAERAKLDSKIVSLQQQQRVLHEECEQYKTNLKNSDNELRATRAEIDKLTTQVEKLKNANFRFKKEKEDAEKALESARKSHLNALTTKDKTIKQLQDDVKKVQDSTKGSGDSYLNYTVALNKLNEKQSELQVLQKQYDQLAVVNGNYETELRQLKRELNEVKDRNGQQREEIQELAIEVDNLKKMKHRRESEEKQAQEEIQDLFASIQS